MNFDVGVIGLGYVGLTLATALSKSGLKVVGIERQLDIVKKVNQGKAHFTETGLENILSDQISNGNLIARDKFKSSDCCKYFIITVGTPIDNNGIPRLDMIKLAVSDIAKKINNGSIVILRSTVEIGTTRNHVEKTLKKTGKKFHLAMCAERTIEGNAMKELNELPQIIGSEEKEGREKAAKLFRRLTNAIIFVNSYETAEIVKLVDNTYRDVQFAFANEIARVCDVVGVNAMEVIEAANEKYPRTNVALPGLVGGPCLVKDPHILRHSVKKYGIDLDITRAARHTNESQPAEIISKLINQFSKSKLKSDLKISLLGMAFKGKPQTNDLRGSMATVILKELQIKSPKSNIGLYDPAVTLEKLKQNYPKFIVYENIYEAITGCDLVIIANNNNFFIQQDLNKLINLLSQDGFIFDFWNLFTNYPEDKYNGKYITLGNLQFLKF